MTPMDTLEPPMDTLVPFVPKDYYLKFSTPEEANSVLLREVMRVVYTEGNPIDPDDPDGPKEVIETLEGTGEYIPNFLNIDTIGIIYEPTGNTLVDLSDPDNPVEYPEVAPIEGHHVNVRVFNSEEPWASLEPYEVPVNSPVRVFGNPLSDPKDTPVDPLNDTPVDPNDTLVDPNDTLVTPLDTQGVPR